MASETTGIFGVDRGTSGGKSFYNLDVTTLEMVVLRENFIEQMLYEEITEYLVQRVREIKMEKLQQMI